MTYNVLGGMLNLALSIYPSQLLAGAAWGLGRALGHFLSLALGRLVMQ